jgi:hypothetical protein
MRCGVYGKAQELSAQARKIQDKDTNNRVRDPRRAVRKSVRISMKYSFSKLKEADDFGH